MCLGWVCGFVCRGGWGWGVGGGGWGRGLGSWGGLWSCERGVVWEGWGVLRRGCWRGGVKEGGRLFGGRGF